MTVRNIVFVDDDHEDSEFFSTALRQLDAEINVSVAFNATEMFQALDNQVPDLLFMDSFLQQQSGQDYIQQIRQYSGCSNLPVIMYSGAADTKAVMQAFDAGATAYLVKPHSIKEIKQMMWTLLEMAGTKGVASLQGLYYNDGAFLEPGTSNK